MLNIYEKCPQPRFFTCGCLENDGGFLHIRRTLNCDVLIFVTEGTLFITMNDTDLAVCPGEYVLLPSGTEHWGTKPCAGRLSYMWVHFSAPKTRGESCPESGFAYVIPEHFTAADPGRVSIIFRQLLDYQRQERLYTEMLPVCTLSMLLMEITQQYLAENSVRCRLFLPFDKAGLVNTIRQEGRIFSEDYTAEGIVLDALVDIKVYHLVESYKVKNEE